MESTETTLPIVDKEALTLQMGTKSTDKAKAIAFCHESHMSEVSVVPLGDDHTSIRATSYGRAELPESFDRLASLD
jgi:hypothetical protein